MPLDQVLSHWRNDPETAPNFAAWRTLPARRADLQPFPADLPGSLADALRGQGIGSLFCHQAEAWSAARAGENLVMATVTASGKTLGYNLPVLAALLEDPQARALYLFPTKALSQDQLTGLQGFQGAVPGLQAAIYDGDTPQAHRPAIRKKARLLLTNPDMLHTGILPHHTRWEDFFRHLRFVVVDEMHAYRGVFGSHVANVLRRLRRAAGHYGARLQFLLASATIGNPRQLAERLIGAPVTLIAKDGSAAGERHFLIYNPPVVDASIGLRKSAFQESIRLADDLLAEAVQSIIFARTRRSVELLLTSLQSAGGEERTRGDRPAKEPSRSSARTAGSIRGYRSGYLPAQRREIEKGLRDGSVRAVVATTALELGIDIGGLGAALLVGYPGTVASTWQQAGRAGRGETAAAAVLVATPSPLDQFLAHHPEYFFAQSPEQALIDPDHLLILLNHLRCAVFELPFRRGEGFGDLPAEKVEEYFEFLVESRQAHLSQDQFFWMADSYPAAAVSLRSASPENVLLQVEDGEGPRLLGEVDLASAGWMVHPRAVYLHEGQQYFVQELDLRRNTAALIPVALDYYTEPLRQTEVGLIALVESLALPHPTLPGPAGHPPLPSPQGSGKSRERVGIGEVCTKAYGEVLVTTQVTGFRKRSWTGGENLGEETLELPPSQLQTTAYWLSLSEATVAALSAEGLWTNAPNDYGSDWPAARKQVRARDGYRCQVCGLPEADREHDVHHRVPFRTFRDEAGRIRRDLANRLDNLVTLCPECHRKAEANVRMRSGLAGLAYALGHLAPLFLMCDPGDLGVHHDPQAPFADGRPTAALYDLVPAGIGFSRRLYELHEQLVARALELVQDCGCEDGCPSCVGPAGENGVGGKLETLAILNRLVRNR
jgi:DEAD/DEAH box helicase domain-containing protein